MEFKFTLDETLFDDDYELVSETKKDLSDITDDVYDDDFSEYEGSDHDPENVLEGPKQGPDTGVADVLIALINDEWEAITGYNNAVSTLRQYSAENPEYERIVNVLEEISSEENVHVGQLQEALKLISPNAAEIQKGTVEAQTQLRSTPRGILPVQSWDDFKAETTKTNNSTPNDVDDSCTLCDVDDEM